MWQIPCSLDAAVPGRLLASPLSAMQKRVLLVDDYSHSLEGLRAWLSGAGWSVETARDAWEAAGKVASGPFDLAIVELDLPRVRGVKMSGWDVVRICQAHHPRCRCIVVGETGSPEMYAEWLAAPLSIPVEKPIDLAKLKALVHALDPEGSVSGSP